MRVLTAMPTTLLQPTPPEGEMSKTIDVTMRVLTAMPTTLLQPTPPEGEMSKT
jgi:hypothetical protein